MRSLPARRTSGISGAKWVDFFSEKFCKAKVGEFDVSVYAYHDVFGLEIAICDGRLVAVHVLKSKKNLCGIEPRLILVELAVALQKSKKITAGHEVENKEVLVFALKCEMQPNNKGVGHLQMSHGTAARIRKHGVGGGGGGARLQGLCARSTARAAAFLQ